MSDFEATTPNEMPTAYTERKERELRQFCISSAIRAQEVGASLTGGIIGYAGLIYQFMTCSDPTKED